MPQPYKYSFLSRIPWLDAMMLLAQLSVNAQTTKVSGKVVDAISREPLPFVNIIFKGTTVGTTTDVEGNYTLSTTLKVDSLIFSYVGYTKLTRMVRKGVAQVLQYQCFTVPDQSVQYKEEKIGQAV